MRLVAGLDVDGCLPPYSVAVELGLRHYVGTLPRKRTQQTPGYRVRYCTDRGRSSVLANREYYLSYERRRRSSQEGRNERNLAAREAMRKRRAAGYQGKRAGVAPHLMTCSEALLSPYMHYYDSGGELRYARSGQSVAKYRASDRGRMAAQMNQIPGDTSQSEIDREWAWFKTEVCRRLAYVTGRQVHTDHIDPSAAGGAHAPWNWQALVYKDNIRKHASLNFTGYKHPRVLHPAAAATIGDPCPWLDEGEVWSFAELCRRFDEKLQAEGKG